ncbi:hypothetical protein [Rossellomorea marisflavi]|uniref:hypothetical protein n=1 Tax=Rossellomorea marisflavi TaxID=189381 RepID=UPI003FA04513
MNFNIGDKVVALSKRVGTRDMDGCASFYKRVEMNQEFLFVNGVDKETSEQLGETVYWCDAVRGMGDRYRESDLIPYLN